MSVRMIRGYQTISEEAADVLAGIPPLDLLTDLHSKEHFERVEVRRGGGNPSDPE